MTAGSHLIPSGRRAPATALIGAGAALAAGALVASVPGPTPTWLLPGATLSVGAGIGLYLALRAPDLFDILRLKLPGVFMLAYVAFIAVPALFVYLIRAGDNAASYLIAIESVLITFPAGVLLVEAFRRRGSRREAGTSPAPWSPLAPSERTMRLIWNGWFATCIVLVVAYVLLIPRIPIVEMFRHSGQERTLELLREQSFKFFPAPLAYLFSWARIFFLPYCGLMAFAMSRTTAKSRAWTVRAAVAFALAILFAGASTAKAPAIYVVVMFVGLSQLLRPQRGLLRLAGVGLAALLISMLVYLKVNGAAPPEAVGSLLQRTFVTPADVAYYYFAIFPNVLPFQHGQTISLLTAALSGVADVHFLDAANYVYLYVFPSGLATGSAGAVFVASAWADFGWLGVVGASLLLGVIVRAIQAYIDARRDVFTVALHAFLLVPFGLTLLSTSLQVTLVTNGVLIAMVTTALLHRLAQPVERTAR